MQLKMSSDSLQDILGTYSEIEALKKFTRLECFEADLDISCKIPKLREMFPVRNIMLLGRMSMFKDLMKGDSPYTFRI